VKKKSGRSRGRPPKHPKVEGDAHPAKPPAALFQAGAINDSDDLCTLCGDGGLILLCDGPCHRSFHLECVGMKDEPNDEQWLCPDCAEGRHMCLICKQVGEMGVEFGVTQCSVAKCGRFYHKGCLATNPLVEWVGKKRFRCPSHFCHACSQTGKKEAASKSKKKKSDDKAAVVSCIHCSQAFHPECIPSADKFIRLSKNLMICANHLSGMKPPQGAARKSSDSQGTQATLHGGSALAAAAAQRRLEVPQEIPLNEDDEGEVLAATEKASGKRKRASSSSSGSKKSKSTSSEKATRAPAAPKVCALCHRGDVMSGGADGKETLLPADNGNPSSGAGTDTVDMALEGPFIEAPVRLKYADKPNESVYVHLNCAVHSPEVYVKADGLIMNLPKAVKRGRQLKCTSCHKQGATVGCVVAKCRHNYHLRCAVESGGEIDGTTYALYCKPHAASRREPTRVCICDADEDDATLTLVCSSCNTKFHPKCVNMSDRHAARMAKTWVCGVCDGSATATPQVPNQVPSLKAKPTSAEKKSSSKARSSSAMESSSSKAASKKKRKTKAESTDTDQAASPQRKTNMKSGLKLPRNKSRPKSNGTPHTISPHMDADSDSDVSTDE